MLRKKDWIVITQNLLNGMANQDTDNKVYGINRIETYTIYKK